MLVQLQLAVMIGQQMKNTPILYWMFDSDAHAWRLALTENVTAWGRSEKVITIHPVMPTEDKVSSIAPTQASTNLDKIYFGREK